MLKTLDNFIKAHLKNKITSRWSGKDSKIMEPQVTKMAATYIAALKCISLIHQNNHWTSKGVNFYSQHKLFEEIYQSALKDLDTAAEAIIGVLGPECVKYDEQCQLLFKASQLYKSSGNDPVAHSLKAEKDFLKFSKVFYDLLEKNHEKSLGLDDIIMSIASSREKAVYLLTQNS